MPSHRRPARRLVAVRAALLVLALPACSDGGDAAAGGSPAPSASVLAGTSDDGFTGARTDVTDLLCERDGAAWAVSGAVTNPLEAPADYRIYVAFVDGAGATRDLQQVDVAGVGPGEERPWSGSADLDEAALECVLRVERVAAG